eukprot:6186990-Amphidinium_carterae.1
MRIRVLCFDFATGERLLCSGALGTGDAAKSPPRRWATDRRPSSLSATRSAKKTRAHFTGANSEISSS